MPVIADESLTKQICPVTPNTNYETTAFIFVGIIIIFNLNQELMSMNIADS